DPALLIADEPTTALDVVTQKKVLELLAEIRVKRRVAILLITHNLGLVAGCGDTVSVMYAGQIVEDGPAVEILRNPAHPYTAGLINAAPSLAGGRVEDLATIPGRVPPPAEWPENACAFAPRCARATPGCFSNNPVNGTRHTVNDKTVRCFNPLT
ncbi:MAG: ABC transporter ATP-binding protein, partial [Kiritimatiellaeota bacterium]|nr:ABC transporter ATP-binding protein [Kiritimatiellota bacterium]